MIKVSVMYPYRVDARFDFEHYEGVHMPLVKKKMGEHCIRWEVDRGLSGGAPGTPPAHVAVAHIYCANVEAFQKGFGPHAAEIRADIPNYTDLQAVVQISAVETRA